MKGIRDCSTVGVVSIALWIVTALAVALQSNRGFALRQSSSCIDETTSWKQHEEQQQQKQRLRFYDTSRKSEGNIPSIAWLMSFPNSGTSYTLRVVRQVSNTTTATNYGDEHIEPSTNSSVVWDNRTRGPFRAYTNLPLPKEFILTKTHCASRCVHCGPDGYLETPLSFQRGCLRSNRVRENKQTEEFYSRDHVKRAVHLMRHPMDNIVARFHLSNRHERSGHFANNASGFQEWCRVLDTSYTWMEQHTRWIDPQLRHLWRSIPCHAEFFRWIQWHNLAYVTGIELGIPVKLLKYEDYNEDWRGTIQALLSFLHLPTSKNAWREASVFEMRSYPDYYTSAQRHHVRKLISQYASVPVWDMVKGYFLEE